MEYNTSAAIKNSIDIQQDKKNFYQTRLAGQIDENNSVFKHFSAENSRDLYNYIDWLGLAKDPDLLVLSSTHHYYYDNEELKKVRNVVHLTQLNQIRELKEFLHTVFHVLPSGTIFIGSFTDYMKKQNGANNNRSNTNSSVYFDPYDNGISSRNSFFSFFYNLLDMKTNRRMSKRSVNLLLEENGFKVLDMTDLEGTTFFCTQKIQLKKV